MPAKKFHRRVDDDGHKKVGSHPQVEEAEDEEEEGMSAGAKKVELEDDPLDKEDAQEETAPPADEEEVDAEPTQDQGPSPQPSPQRGGGDQSNGNSGPKINFDYPGNTPSQSAFSQTAKPQEGPTLDDLAQEGQEEYDQPNQPAQTPGGPAPRNPYAQPAQEVNEFGMRSIRQPQQGPSFPAPQNMNSNNGNVRPPSQYAPQPGGFNFRRDGGNYRSGSPSNKVYFIVLLAIGLVVLGGAVYLLKNQLKPPAPKPSPAPEVAITTPEPAPTPQAIDRSQFTVRILNGSGKTGLAADVSNKLKELGYKVERTGNATNSSFQQTLVRGKDDPKLIEQLIKDLSYQFEAASGSAIRANDPSDAEIILGAK